MRCEYIDPHTGKGNCGRPAKYLLYDYETIDNKARVRWDPEMVSYATVSRLCRKHKRATVRWFDSGFVSYPYRIVRIPVS